MSILRWMPVVVGMLAGAAASGAAEARPWLTFTNCQYVAADSNDGDSFRVKGGTNEFNVRLYFVDAPETTLQYPERVREQAEYFSVTLDDTLKAGAQARNFTRELLQPPFTVRTRYAQASGRSKEPRYYGFVEVGGTNLAEILVRHGLARTKGITAALPSGPKSRDYSAKLQALEAEARQQKRGAWAKSAGAKNGL